MVGKSWVTSAFILMMKSNDTLSDDCGCYDYMECLIAQTRADNTSPDNDKKQRLCNAGYFFSEAQGQYEVLQDDRN